MQVGVQHILFIFTSNLITLVDPKEAYIVYA